MVGLLSLAFGATPLAWAPAPVDNPLKGLVPYAGERRRQFPYSMEFSYLPLSDLMKGPNRYDWTALERLLNDIASRGHQTVFRIFLEYPNRPNGLPDHLRESGVQIVEWKDSDGTNRTPDYNDPRLRQALRQFISALGKRYDNDPRVVYITAGLLGKWGEWHDYPRSELFASKEVQREVMNAYAGAFRHTPVLLRYPAGADDPVYAPNVTRGFGYHDDSFAFATLKTTRSEDGWFYMALLDRAKANDAWKTRPIGGEIRPEVWGRIFDPNPGQDAQDFDTCVRETHATWLMDTGMFGETPPSSERRRRAEASVRRMGYEITATSVAITPGRVRLTLQNRGVAPFYRNWPAEWGLLRNGKVIAARRSVRRQIMGILPGATAIWNERLVFGSVPKGQYTLGLRIPNPMKGGHPLGFANKDYERDAKGWLSLGEYRVR
ncbi:DUF4832 domain-containing protein [bacterium]|nr:MAG: DUF4832 domain-containing protein [bacterium]